jgi:preprotein translocase subunit SecY
VSRSPSTASETAGRSLIVTGIVDVPTAFYRLIDPTNPQTYLTATILAVTYFLIVIGVVYTQRGQRRIPMQSAKMVRGGRMMGGQKHYLPVKLNMPSVMPVIFASSLIMLPLTLIQTIRGQANLPEWIGSGTFVHVTLYCAMIVFFSFFWTSPCSSRPRSRRSQGERCLHPRDPSPARTRPRTSNRCFRR